MLYLHTNELTGAVPSFLANLTNLTELYLYGNSFTGPLPAEIGQVREFESRSDGQRQL